MAENNAKKGFFAKIGDFFKGIGKAFANMWRELKKVTWPTREKLVRYSFIVVLFIIFMMVVIGLLDLGATQLVALIGRL